MHADEVARVVDGVAPGGLEADLDDAGDRRHAVRVDEEEHVVARRGEVRAAGELHVKAARPLTEVEFGHALVLVEGVRDGAEADHRHLRDAGGVRRRDEEVRVEGDFGRGPGDGRARAFEEVRRREELIVRLVDFARPRWEAAPRREHPAVGQQQRRRVVEPPSLHARHGGPCLGVWVVNLRREDRPRWLIEPRAARPAGSEDRAVGQERGVQLAAAEGHVADPAPLRRGRDGGRRAGDDRRDVEVNHLALAARYGRHRAAAPADDEHFAVVVGDGGAGVAVAEDGVGDEGPLPRPGRAQVGG